MRVGVAVRTVALLEGSLVDFEGRGACQAQSSNCGFSEHDSLFISIGLFGQDLCRALELAVLKKGLKLLYKILIINVCNSFAKIK